MINNSLYFALFFGTAAIFSAQNVGINTPNPQGILHVDGGRDNPQMGTTFTAQQQSNDFVIKNDSKAGLGTLSPKVKLDIRDANNADSEIGIGYTTLAAASAGEGALRYEPATKTMQYSDGFNWIRFEPLVAKAVVIATKTSSKNRDWNIAASVFTENASTIPNDRQTYLTDWIEKYDNLNSFNPVTGIFTAPVDGIYLASYTTAINSTAIRRDFSPQYEHQFELYPATTTYANMNPNTQVLEKTKCNNSFSAGTANASTTTNVGGNCTMSFSMKAGQILVFDLYVALLPAAAKTLINTGGYNNLTIIQQ